MADILTPADLAPFVTISQVKAEAMIADAVAQAALVAPCLLDEDAGLPGWKLAAAKAILRSAILRWEETGAGGVRTQQSSTAGPITEAVTTMTGARKAMFWPNEIRDLRRLCAQVSGAAFEINTLPPREEAE